MFLFSNIELNSITLSVSLCRITSPPILSLIFWGMIWGIIGVLLSAPLTAIIRVTFERFDSTRQIARLLEGKIHLKS